MAAPSPLRTSDLLNLGVVFEVDAHVVRLHGEVDHHTAPFLLTAAMSFLHVIPGDLTVDLAGVTFADSALINSLVRIRKAQHQRDADLEIVHCSARVKRMLLLSGLTGLLRPAAAV